MRKNRPMTIVEWASFWAIVVILGFVSSKVRADSIALNWTNPTETETCTNAGPYTNQGGTRIWQLVADIPDGTVTSYQIDYVKPGTYTYTSTAYSAGGTSSRISSTAEKTITAWKTVDTKVRSVSKTNGNFFLPVVGSIPLGTDCRTDISVEGQVFDSDGVTIIQKKFYAVDDADVTFTGVQDILVVAECG